MLRELSVRNLAIAESLELRAEPGLNALTGETGAGKSIVFTALGLALGGRGAAEQVRTGAGAAEVIATFEGPFGSRVRQWLLREGLPAQPEVLVLRRVQPLQGATRCWVNDHPVRVGQLRELGAELVDFAGQHAHQALLDPDQHLGLLDRTAALGELPEQMREAARALATARQELDRLEDSARHRQERSDFLRYQLRELEAVDLRPGEKDALVAERRVQRHAVELRAGVRRAEEALYSGDRAAVDALSAAEAALRPLLALDPALEGLGATLNELLVGAEELARELGRRARGFEHDPQRLDEIEGRLAEIERLQRKHRCEAEELVTRREALALELGGLEQLDERREALHTRLHRAQAQALAVAERLHAARCAAARALEQEVAERLRGLAMPYARFEVRLLPVESGERVGDLLLGEQGLDRAELYLSANPGEEPRPLARVASGGELSRVLLALRLAVQASGAVGCFVFDEIDSGIGGVAAEVVGERLRELSGRCQVLCITHLPRIASLAHAHFAVRKEVVQGRTCSSLERLDGEARVGELARMVGGGSLGAASEQWARELLASQRRLQRVA